jgi:hypothetical protein
MEVKRICIDPKDIARITGKSDRSGQRLMARVRAHYRKSERQLVTVDEFSSYTGIAIEQVKRFITD